MATELDVVKRTLEEYLRESQHLDNGAIRRVVLDDLEYLLNWELPPDSQDELQNAQAVIAFSFGYGPEKPGVSNAEHHPYHPSLHEPGKSNIAIAGVIKQFADTGKSIFAQWEVAEALRENFNILDIGEKGRTCREARTISW